MKIIKFLDSEALAKGAAEFTLEQARKCIEQRGIFQLCLSGGSTPKRMFQLLAEQPDAVNWEKWRFYFGDERTVPPNHEDSNFRMATENLFEPLKINSDQVFQMPADKEDLNSAAKEYEDLLQQKLSDDPIFDLILLGMGADGHTASLFPDADALSNLDDWVTAATAPSLGVDRMTITYRTINNARTRAILLGGEGKASRLKKVFEQLKSTLPDHKRYPIARINPKRGEIHWLLDNAAASELDSTHFETEN